MLERPLEYALVEFKGNEFSGKIVPELLEAGRLIPRVVTANKTAKTNPFFISLPPFSDFYENAAECPALWAGMNAAIPKNR